MSELPTLTIVENTPSKAVLELALPNGEVETITVHRDGRIDRTFGPKPTQEEADGT